MCNTLERVGVNIQIWVPMFVHTHQGYLKIQTGRIHTTSIRHGQAYRVQSCEGIRMNSYYVVRERAVPKVPPIGICGGILRHKSPYLIRIHRVCIGCCRWGTKYDLLTRGIRTARRGYGMTYGMDTPSWKGIGRSISNGEITVAKIP